ncbi:MAG TPA: AraC family transcriptional regulator [Candidatus Methylacidiphilales bacterium]|jgi:AraC-like DNA-binding protein|nr:AraC family transcriptional regulator [Candidatus Methylacidiphilales bacterium]
MRAILEKVSYGRGHSFVLFDYGRNRAFDCPFHYHPEIELTLIVESAGHRYVGDHIGRFTPGDLVLMGPNLPHSYVSDERTRFARSVVLQFLPACLGAGFFQLGEMRSIHALLERSRVGLAFHGATRERAARALMQLVAIEGTARLVGFLELLQQLAGSREYRRLASPTYAPSLALYQGERINRVCELISRKFRENVTQAEASRVAKMSGPSFSRFFRRATNRTFRAFLNEVRVGHASRLLLESDQSVAEICYDSGFGNLSNFNRQFLKLRKISPRDYRRHATNSTA